MAQETVRRDSTEKPQAKRQGRSGMVAAAVLVGLAAAGALAYVGLSEEPVGGSMVDSAVEDARPVGAGTLPDGEADEFNEGLTNETSRDDFIAPNAPTDAFTNPLLEADGTDALQATSIEELEPGPAVDDEVLQRMAPHADDADDRN